MDLSSMKMTNYSLKGIYKEPKKNPTGSDHIKLSLLWARMSETCIFACL